VILNNWHDIEFCRRLMLDPHGSEHVLRDAYFESVGHGYQILWRTGLWLLSGALDPDLIVLPDPRRWEDAFQVLKQEKTKNFTYGEPNLLPDLGAFDLFEGQARFTQLQYLHFASGAELDWDDFRSAGFLGDVYTRAFAGFLHGLDEPWPTSVGDPLVATFLAACDLAINPTEGFPFDIRHAPSFVFDVDPGFRFIRIVKALRSTQTLRRNVTSFSRDEYIELTETVSEGLLWPSPLAAAERIAVWRDAQPAVASLIQEDAEFRFTNANLPVRLFAGRFLAFQRDKLRMPEFFAWPGACMVSQSGSTSLGDAGDAFYANAALFLDAPNGEVRPHLLVGRKTEDIYKTFQAFFAWISTYDLVRQWHVERGPFIMDYDWLTPGVSPEQVESWGAATFASVFNVRPQDFWIL